MIGTSGSGKTTLARQLAERLDLRHLELDAVFHQPGWTPLPDDEFTKQVGDFCAGDRWVVCGKYAQVAAHRVRARGHDRVPRPQPAAPDAARRRRTVRRARRREVLWNGNREPWRGVWPFQDAEQSIVRWTWDNVPSARVLFDEVEAEWRPRGVDVVRLRGWRNIETWAEHASR